MYACMCVCRERARAREREREREREMREGGREREAITHTSATTCDLSGVGDEGGVLREEVCSCACQWRNHTEFRVNYIDICASYNIL